MHGCRTDLQGAVHVDFLLRKFSDVPTFHLTQSSTA